MIFLLFFDIFDNLKWLTTLPIPVNCKPSISSEISKSSHFITSERVVAQVNICLPSMDHSIPLWQIIHVDTG